MPSNAFLVTRPVQYFNVENIPKDGANNTLLIVRSFVNAEQLCRKVSRMRQTWSSVELFDDVFEALRWMRQNKTSFTDFFTFSDFGLRLCILLGRLRPLRIHIYEEGLATYMSDEVRGLSIKHAASILSSRNLGRRRHMGQCQFVDSLYLHHIHLHRQLFPDFHKELRSFSRPLLEQLELAAPTTAFDAWMPENLAERECLLYLSGWTINKKIRSIISAHFQSITIAKLHPGYKGGDGPASYFDHIIESHVPAELAIQRLAARAKHLTVVHESSSSVLNCLLAGIAFSDINLGSSEAGLAAKFQEVRNALEIVNATVGH